jgi:hypothetical protein
MEAAGFAYPVIAKPDRGERGLGVARLNSDRDLARYLASAPVGTLIQRWIPGDREFGVLFCRDPVTDRGWISSVVIKDPLEVVGDGRSTLSELIDTSDRARIFRSRLVRQYRERLTEIPAAGARVPLSEFGNHSRGSIFRDGNRCITPELTRRFQEISRGIDGFYCGRFDIKAQSIEAITRGEFVILELNGAASEPAHIYDPHNTLLRAYRDLFRHWVTIYEISRTNRRRGVAADSLWRTIAAIRRHAREGSVLRSNTLGL